MLIFISGHILGAIFLTLSENGYFLAKLLLKSVAFYDLSSEGTNLTAHGAIAIQVYILWRSAADFISLSGIPYCPVFPTYTLYSSSNLLIQYLTEANYFLRTS